MPTIQVGMSNLLRSISPINAEDLQPETFLYFSLVLIRFLLFF